MKGRFLVFVIIWFLPLNLTLQSCHSNTNVKSIVILPFQNSKPPHFPGGFSALNKFLSANLRYPNTGDDVQGRVIVTFIVKENGQLSNLKVTQKLFPEFNAEALRVVKLLPPWVPAMKNGKPIKAEISLPLNFTLNE